jgi:hypothetical protein
VPSTWAGLSVVWRPARQQAHETVGDAHPGRCLQKLVLPARVALQERDLLQVLPAAVLAAGSDDEVERPVDQAELGHEHPHTLEHLLGKLDLLVSGGLESAR